MSETLRITDLTFQFDDKVILSHLNLQLHEGEIHALVGLTGAGKTLLLKLIAGLLPQQTGFIESSAEKVAFVFQTNSFFSWLTIGKNLEMSTGLSESEIQPWLKNFNLEGYFEMYPKELSGGTVQKFNLLRAFLVKAPLILLDEPFSHLDIIQKEDLYNFMGALWKQSRPMIILVTHDIDEALAIANNVSFLSKKKKTVTHSIALQNASSSSHFRDQIKSWLREDLC